MELLERDGDREVLETAISESRSAGRVVVVAGEAGIGKTALVTAVVDGRRAGPLGRLRSADHAAADGPAATTSPARSAARCWPRSRAARARPCWPRRSTSWPAARCSSSRTCTGPTTRRSTCWRCSGRRLLRSPGCLILTSRNDAGPRCGACSAALPRECVRRIEPAALSPRGRRAAGAARGARARGPAHGLGRQPVLRHRGAGRARGRASRPACATRWRCASTRSARRRARSSSWRPSSRRASSCRWSAAAGEAIDECIDAGLLTPARRHAGLPPRPRPPRGRGRASRRVRQRELDGRVLEALEALRRRRPGAARAPRPPRRRRGRRSGGSRPPRPAPRAAAHGHRQALEHWEAALLAPAGDPGGARGRRRRGLPVRARRSARSRRGRALLAIHEAAGDALRAGDDLRWLSRVLWWAGRGTEAATVGDRRSRCSRPSRTAASWRRR